MAEPIYKIMSGEEWTVLETAGTFDGAPVDLKDGYVHLSTAAQVEETAAKHFAGRTGLKLVAVDPGALGDALKWEMSRGGALFPHLYAALPLSAVVRANDLPLGGDGFHRFPDLSNRRAP